MRTQEDVFTRFPEWSDALLELWLGESGREEVLR
jgi:hypothetical protein